MRGDGLGTSTKLVKVKHTALPPWDIEQTRDFACAYACADPTATAHLLAWSIIEDERPLRNHNAAFLVEQPGKPWTVVVMYRHATNDWWNINVSFHSPARPVVTFPQRPTIAEVDGVFDENRWRFEHDEDADGFKVLAGNVIDEVWEKVLRGSAPQHFPKGVEQ